MELVKFHDLRLTVRQRQLLTGVVVALTSQIYLYFIVRKSKTSSLARSSKSRNMAIKSDSAWEIGMPSQIVFCSVSRVMYSFPVIIQSRDFPSDWLKEINAATEGA